MVRNAQTGRLEMFHEITFCHDWPARLQALHRAAVAAHESYCELESLVPSEFGPPPAGTRHETVQLAAAAWFQVSAISDAGCLALAEWEADMGAEVEDEEEEDELGCPRLGCPMLRFPRAKAFIDGKGNLCCPSCHAVALAVASL